MPRPARWIAAPTRSAAELLADLHAHVAAMPICTSVRSVRHCAQVVSLERTPTWRCGWADPTPARLADLHRLKAWPFVSWCFVQRHLVPDVDLLLAKPGGCGLPVEWAEHDRTDFAAVAEAAAVLGWSAELAAASRAAGRLARSACTWESASAS